jgi:uncharacterized membrane protein (UPF0127 family)
MDHGVPEVEAVGPQLLRVIMRTLKIINQSKNSVLGEKIAEAKGVIDRVKGLMGRPALREGEGLFIPRCSSIHTFGMRAAIDVIFIDVESRIIKLKRGLAKNKLCSCLNAAGVIELPVGMIDKSRSEVGGRVEMN